VEEVKNLTMEKSIKDERKWGGGKRSIQKNAKKGGKKQRRTKGHFHRKKVVKVERGGKGLTRSIVKHRKKADRAGIGRGRKGHQIGRGRGNKQRTGKGAVWGRQREEPTGGKRIPDWVSRGKRTTDGTATTSLGGGKR